MFGKSASYRHKNQVRVKITLAGQTPFEAFVFLKVEERLIDLLNDERAFIPVRRSDGATVITAKTNIVSIVEYDDPVAGEGFAAAPEDVAPEDISDAAAPDFMEQEDAVPAETDSGPDTPADKAHDAAPADDREPAAEQTAAPERSRHRFDPYQMLRVPREASLEDIRKAYKARIKAVHPDALAALDLDEDVERAANLTAQKVNRAYKQILRERKKAEDPEARVPEADETESASAA